MAEPTCLCPVQPVKDLDSTLVCLAPANFIWMKCSSNLLEPNIYGMKVGIGI